MDFWCHPVHHATLGKSACRAKSCIRSMLHPVSSANLLSPTVRFDRQTCLSVKQMFIRVLLPYGVPATLITRHAPFRDPTPTPSATAMC